MNADSYKYIRFNASQETRWATVEEIQNSCTRVDLTAEDYPVAGLPVLSDTKVAYVDGSDTHTLIFGATGSKKTRLFCMPMLNMMAKAGESFIVSDPKGELYAQTSGLVKEKGYKLVVLNFRDIGNGDRWNPLAIPYEMWHNGDQDGAGMLLSDIVYALAEKQINNSKDAFWPEAAQELAIAAMFILMQAGKPEEANMRSFTKLCSYANVDMLKDLSDMMNEDSVSYINLKSTVCTDAKVTVSGIVSTLFGMLRLFCVNDKLATMLADTTFDMRQFGREKTAVYIIVPDEKSTYHALVTMFVKQAYEILISEAHKEKNRQLPIRVNFVLDEFCNIPRIPDMATMISAARSRNMRYYLIVQSLHQLKGRYHEDADTIKGNCDNWVFLTSKELDLLREISDLCGTTTTAGGGKRLLISPSELQRFNKQKGEALIMHARQYPVISELPDISAYEMYGIYEPVDIPPYAADAPVFFSLTRLMEAIKNQKAIAPFASERHMIQQGRKIYRVELRRATEAAKSGKKGDPNIGDIISTIRRVRNENEEKAGKKGAAAAAESVVDPETIAKDMTRRRVAALMGDAFAQYFMDKRLYDPSNDDDDDDFFDFD